MKHLRLFLPAILLLTSLTGLPSLRADDAAAHLATAGELLKAMNSEGTIDRAVEQMGMIADRLYPPGRSIAGDPADDAALRQSLRQECKDIFKEQLKWETLEPQFAQMYADAFTEPELKQLIEFYKSPVGQKLIEKQPDLSQKFQKITQQKFLATVPIVQQKLRASIQKFKDEHPAKVVPPASPSPAGSPLTPGAPAASPAPAAAATPGPMPGTSSTPAK